MHEGHEKAKRAHETMTACAIDVGAGFEALGASKIKPLLAHLEHHRLNKYGSMNKYRQPRGSANSRVRPFHDLLQRRATFRIASNGRMSM
jgi:hypothetical protein